MDRDSCTCPGWLPVYLGVDPTGPDPATLDVAGLPGPVIASTPGRVEQLLLVGFWCPACRALSVPPR